jgi:hypothetical protein
MIIIIALLLPFLGVGLYLYKQVKKAGRNESKLEAVETANKGLKNENDKLSDRPRNKSDRVKRLQSWRDSLPK